MEYLSLSQWGRPDFRAPSPWDNHAELLSRRQQLLKIHEKTHVVKIQPLTFYDTVPDALIHPWKSSSIFPEITKFIDTISKSIVIGNREELAEFLLSESYKLPSYESIVLKIASLKSNFFGDDAQLILQLNHDPEIKNEFLKFYIRQTNYPSDFMEKLDRLQEGYFDLLHKYDIWILVSTDFKTPLLQRE